LLFTVVIEPGTVRSVKEITCTIALSSPDVTNVNKTHKRYASIWF
jgi:hypothetical protein